MTKHIAILDGHPDPAPGRFVHALAHAYSQGAVTAGHEVRMLKLAGIDVPILRSRDEWMEGTPARPIVEAQELIGWAEHLVIFYPLWLGDIPALLKAFLEQVARPGFALAESERGPVGLLKGKTARLVVTMGMPAIFYRLVYGAHSVKSFERNILKMAGIKPVGHTLIGNVEAGAEEREKWLGDMGELGRKGG